MARLRLLSLALSTALITACGGGASDAPQNTPEPVVAGKITLSGVVTDNPIVNASVMVRIAEDAFDDAPPTGSNGEFQLDISSQNPEALVMAEALDAVNGVKLTAVLDTFANYSAQARNGVVDGVKITNVTTALQVLVERLAADGSIDTFNEFHQLAGEVDANELYELAAAIKVVVENIDGSVLPAGLANTEALARAIAAGQSSFLNDIATTAPAALAEARSKLLNDGNATLPFEAVSAPGVYLSLSDNFTYAVFNNGTALVDYGSDESVPGTPSWSLNDNGQIIVSFVGFERATDSLSSIGAVGDVMHVVVETDFRNAQSVQASSVRKINFAQGFDAASVPGSWIDGDMETSRWVFETGNQGYRLNTQTQIQSDAFTWSITSDGRINMLFTGTDESMQFARLDDGDDAVLQVSRFNGEFAYLSTTTLTPEG
ncbi:MAG: hypothetical protein AB8G16_11375 [Gammaproteobacteria bacterium]